MKIKVAKITAKLTKLEVEALICACIEWRVHNAYLGKGAETTQLAKALNRTEKKLRMLLRAFE